MHVTILMSKAEGSVQLSIRVPAKYVDQMNWIVRLYVREFDSRNDFITKAIEAYIGSHPIPEDFKEYMERAMTDVARRFGTVSLEDGEAAEKDADGPDDAHSAPSDERTRPERYRDTSRARKRVARERGDSLPSGVFRTCP